MTIDVAITSWGGDCGPRPQSTSTAGGGTFRITQEGDQLTFHMRRQRTTRGCWSENRAVRRVSSTAQSGTWRIVCRTPPDDPRSETGTYTIQAIGSDQLSFRDVSAYDWQLNDSRCVATITTTQTFTRVAGPPAPVAEAPREEPEAACTPGAAARLVLRPATADVTPGGQQCFTARVVDAQGCALRSQRVEFELAEGAGTLEGRCYRAPEADGTARIVARAGGLSSEARVTVRAVDLSDLIARRIETGSPSGSAGGDATASADTAARVSTRASGESIDSRWVVAAGGAALLLLIGGAIALMRRSKPRGGSIAGLPGVEIPDDSAPGEAPTAEAGPQPAASSTGEPEGTKPTGQAIAASPPRASPSEDMICPVCRRGHPPGSVRCAHDGTMLVPYREFAAAKGRDNVCPVCGERYPAHMKFCGKDGAPLRGADG